MVKDVVVQLRDKGAVERPYLGVTIREMSALYARQQDLPEDTQGALIWEIYRDSPAHRYGLEPGDVIYEFQGKRIVSSDELVKAVSQARPGNEVEIKVLREGRKRSVEVVMGRYIED